MADTIAGKALEHPVVPRSSDRDEDQDGDHGGDGNRGLGSRPHPDGMIIDHRSSIIDHYHLISRW